MVEGYFLRGLLLEEIDLATLDSKIGSGQVWAQGLYQHLITLQLVQCLIERGRKATDASPFALLVTEVGWIDLGGLSWINLVINAIQTCREQSTQCQVGIAAVVGRF